MEINSTKSGNFLVCNLCGNEVISQTSNCKQISEIEINPFHATDLFLYPLKISETYSANTKRCDNVVVMS